jgi:signal transduction histidine kinase
MLDRLSESFLSQERFIADAAHELKTPLAVLLGEAQVLMKQERTPEEYARFVANVQDEVRALAQTVDSLLNLARAEAGIPMADVRSVPVNEAVMDAAQRCSPLAAQREMRLTPVLALPDADQPEAVVRGDGSLLRLMVTNLIRNAIRYSPPDTSLEVHVGLAGGQAVISVRDHGPGIPDEFREKVFDRFFRVPGDKSSCRGVGLGLTIVRGIARLHGGDVGVRNRPEGGCEFTVRLPIATGDTPAETPHHL